VPLLPRKRRDGSPDAEIWKRVPALLKISPDSRG
jgi:hypothetical protein